MHVVLQTKEESFQCDDPELPLESMSPVKLAERAIKGRELSHTAR